MHKLPNYTSDIESFMNSFLARHPDVVEDQKRGWYIWWDHRLDLDEDERVKTAEELPKPYSYD